MELIEQQKQETMMKKYTKKKEIQDVEHELIERKMREMVCCPQNTFFG